MKKSLIALAAFLTCRAVEDSQAAVTREPTFGERACGVSFNPGGHEAVNAIKRRYADLIDDLNDRRVASDNPEVKRMLSLAITESQTAQMWAVKAVTWQK